jgi:hypothetical protein
MVKTLKDWIIRSQVLKVNKPMDAVHRLNVDGVYIGTLRYSRFPCENKALRKNYNKISLIIYYRESLKGHSFKKRNVVLKL